MRRDIQCRESCSGARSLVGYFNLSTVLYDYLERSAHFFKGKRLTGSNSLLPLASPELSKSLFLANHIVQHKDSGMDFAIHEAWAAYCEESTWSKVSNVDYWVVTRCVRQPMNSAHMLVHYNLLTGELLVDGLPLTRLPSDYECNRAYRSLFGNSQLDVMPSSSPGMQFSCQTKYLGYTVHLGKELVPESTEFDLSVRAVRDGRVWEFVPPRILAGFLPDAFVERYANWYAVKDDYVEFRSTERPWSSDGQIWRLQRSCSNTAWHLEKHGTFLVSTTSPTANMISNIFQPVEKV